LSEAPPPRSEALTAVQRRHLDALLAKLASDHAAPTSVRDPERARAVHVEDSLCGLDVPALAAAGRIADIGAGAGFPALVLAIALPGAEVTAIEATARKCEFMRGVARETEIGNVAVVAERAETWALAEPPEGGRGAYDAVTARAVGRLATLAELASPLLREGGLLVAWKGRRDAEEEAEAERAVGRTAMRPLEVLPVAPFAASRHRHLHVFEKSGPTPEGLPRRPGMAKKRPLGS
jgi:16S rRNA (guanine527-N7)-methyltransferase